MLAGSTGAAVAAADLPSQEPPANIAPAKTTLTAVLDGNRRASGRRPPGSPQTRIERWNVSYGSLSGSRAQWQNGDDYRVDQTLGPDRTGWGVLAGRQWDRNANGQVTLGRSLHHRDAIDSWAVRSASHAGVALLGQTSAPISAYVVKIDPPGGRLQYVFYDKTTQLIDRIEEVRDGRRVTLTYSDYRTTDGLTEPWHVHTTDGFATNDDDEKMQSLSIGEPVPAADLAIPAGGPPLLTLSGPSASVPVSIADDRIVIPTRMGGHTVDFLFDSGAGGIVIDKDVVEALNVAQYGRITSATAGAYVESSVVLPRVTIGPLSMENVHAIALPFLQWTSSGKPIAGLLGFDFIASLVWHVDYQHGTLEAINPATFAPPPGAHAFAIAFDDAVPTLAATISGVKAEALIVDTGADRSTLFSPFTGAHSSELSDQGLGAQMQAASPFVDDFLGVGGTVDYRPLQTGPFVIGPWTFPKWLFYVTQDAPAFEFEDYDGLVGQDLLRNFDLYLDYPHAKIYLVPNDRFRQRWTL